MTNEQDHLLVTQGPRAGEEISLARLPLTIGRLETADVVFDLSSISRMHARVSLVDASYLIEDLGSSNGTFVNEERLEAARPLADGDYLRFGPELELRFVLAAVAPLGGETVIMHAADLMNETILGGRLTPAAPVPPQLVVNDPGGNSVVYELTAPRIRIGRNPDNDVVLENRYISRYHAELEKRGADYYLVPSPDISNALLLDGQAVMEPTLLQHTAKIRVGGFAPGEIVTLDYLSPSSEAHLAGGQVIQFAENRTMTIGRGEDNDIVLPGPTVSRYHAEVEKIGQRYRLRDLRSGNGTFVNGQSVTGEAWVQPGDAIQIGPYRFVVAEHEFAQSDQSEGGVQVEVYALNKWVNRDLNILQDISLVFQPKEFIVVVGQSGGGKSTLVDAIAGYRPATHGRVIVNKTVDVYKEFDSIRSTIGYVPQKDIIHMELTVFEALEYVARLRMPQDTTREERTKRVEEVMEDLDLAHRRDTQIGQLSGGQQKRVSIGVELLTKPGLFFLDEPTSGLDPGMETELMRLMRRLADQGRTIIMVTHATKNVMLADKVVFLARGGYLAWFGPPEEALVYFDAYRSERDRRSSPMEFDHIYTLLDQEELGQGQDWADRFRQYTSYYKYIGGPLNYAPESLKGDTLNLKRQPAQATARPPARLRQISALRQFFILSSRHLKITARDRFSLALLLVTAPVMASLDFVIALGVGHNPLGFNGGSFNSVIITLISLSNTAILVGGLACMRELVKERDIYKRERMVNLRLFPYLMSKVWFALVLAVYMAVCFTAIRYLAFEMPGGSEALMFFFFTVFLLIVAGMMMGFFASALAPNANAAPLLLILFIIPQMVLSGGLVPLPSMVTAAASSRWTFQSALAIGGAGSDVAGDECWSLPQAEQDKLTLDEKNKQCTCMGENALHEDSCNFPGLGQYYDTAIDEQDPPAPAAPGPQPPDPVLPPTPVPPQDLQDTLAVVQFLNDLSAYNVTTAQIQTNYKAQFAAWQKQQEEYAGQVNAYRGELTDLKVRRATAVGSAESSIRRYKDDFGWTFVNKNDRQAYLGILYRTWAAQLVIILALFAGTIIMQKQRDVV